MVQRWTLHDPALDEDWTFPVNPNKMGSPHAPRALTILATAPSNGAPSSQGRIIEGNTDPYEWSFSGFIRTEDHHDQFRYWSKKVNRLVLTDHFGRSWSIRMIQFAPEELRPTINKPWRFNYEIKTLNYGAVA